MLVLRFLLAVLVLTPPLGHAATVLRFSRPHTVQMILDRIFDLVPESERDFDQAHQRWIIRGELSLHFDDAGLTPVESQSLRANLILVLFGEEESHGQTVGFDKSLVALYQNGRRIDLGSFRAQMDGSSAAIGNFIAGRPSSFGADDVRRLQMRNCAGVLRGLTGKDN